MTVHSTVSSTPYTIHRRSPFARRFLTVCPSGCGLAMRTSRDKRLLINSSCEMFSTEMCVCRGRGGVGCSLKPVGIDCLSWTHVGLLGLTRGVTSDGGRRCCRLWKGMSCISWMSKSTHCWLNPWEWIALAGSLMQNLRRDGDCVFPNCMDKEARTCTALQDLLLEKVIDNRYNVVDHYDKKVWTLERRRTCYVMHGDCVFPSCMNEEVRTCTVLRNLLLKKVIDNRYNMSRTIMTRKSGNVKTSSI